MSTVTPSRPAPPGSAPRARRPAPTSARTIDPFRLLRRHVVLLAGTAVAGVFLGVVLYFILAIFFPRYRGEVFFEVRAGLHDSRSISSEDVAAEDLLFRIAS